MFKEFAVKDVLNVEQTKSVVAKADLTEGDIPYVTRTVSDNGYMGTCGNKDKENKGNCITIGAETGVAFYQPNDFVAGNKVYRLSRAGLNEKEYLFLASILNVQTKNYSYSNARIPEKIKAERILLPVIESADTDHEYTVDDIDWQSIQNFITKLEQDYIAEIKRERIAELDAYLIAAGLDNYELADEDKRIPASSKEVKLGKFSLGGEGGLFNIYSPKKRFNANTVQFGGKYPYVARGSSNNGIRGYITEDEQYLSPAKSLSFGQDTATVYYQPDAYFTGDKIKVMVLNNRELTPELAEYFIAAIAKAFSNFAWGQNSFNESIIKSTKIVLPVKSDGTPDFDYMERYIRVIEKLTVADMVTHKDRTIAAAKQVINT